MSRIRIKNIRLRTIIGIESFERTNKQDIVINVALDVDTQKAAVSDDIVDALDYKKLTKSIIAFVEATDFFLLERLCDEVLDIVMQDKRILWGQVEIDKPGALRFCDSVSLEVSRDRN